MALTDASDPSFYSASFSPQAGFYLLSYQGPDIPWQRIIQAGDKSRLHMSCALSYLTRTWTFVDFDYILTDNAQLNETWSQFEAPLVMHKTIESDGYGAFIACRSAPTLLKDIWQNWVWKKSDHLGWICLGGPSILCYSVCMLIRISIRGIAQILIVWFSYGGPGSQLTDLKFDRDWHHYVACGLQYIVVVVDGRGTGFKGRKLRNPVRNNLGFFETQDQINAAKWASNLTNIAFPLIPHVPGSMLQKSMSTLHVLGYGDGWVSRIGEYTSVLF